MKRHIEKQAIRSVNPVKAIELLDLLADLAPLAPSPGYRSFVLWAWCEKDPILMSPQIKQGLLAIKELAKDCEGWWYRPRGAVGPLFVPMNEWLDIYEAIT